VVEQQKKYEFTLQKFVEATQKKKIKKATKSETNRLASNAHLLVLHKDGREGFARIQLRLALHHIRTLV
jgi:hypothetical protein